jgi:hypothetical protein
MRETLTGASGRSGQLNVQNIRNISNNRAGRKAIAYTDLSGGRILLLPFDVSIGLIYYLILCSSIRMGSQSFHKR